MNTINEKKDALIREIREGSVYKRFEEAKKSMGAFPDKKVLMDTFREKAYMLTTQDGEPGADALQILEEREHLKEDPLIAEYLESELALCRMLQKISVEILNVSDLEIDSFSDRIQVR